MSSALKAFRRLANRGVLKKLLSWYLTPSGVVLAIALALLLASLLAADAPWYTTIPAVGALGIFLPYKFWREQTLQANRASEIESALRSQMAELERKLERKLGRRLERKLGERIDVNGKQIGTVAMHAAEAIRVQAEAVTSLDTGIAELRASTRAACQDVA